MVGQRVGAPPYVGHRLGTPGFRRVAVAQFAAGVATFAALYCPQPLLPLLADRFSLSSGAAALSVSVATLTLGLGLLVAGPLSDARGRVGFVRGSLLVSALVGVGCAAAPTWPLLLALRAVQGLALAGLPAVAIAYLREEVDPAAHARATGLYVGGTAIGGMTGRLLSAGLADAFGWRAAFAGIGLLGLLCAAVVVALLPPSRAFRPAPLRPRALLALTGRLLGDPVLLALDGIAALLMGAFVAVYNAIGFRLVAPPYRLSVAAAGLVFLVYAFGSLGSALAGRAADRWGRRPVVPVGVAVAGTGMLLTLAAPLPAVVAGVAVMTFGFFAAHGVASGWVAARAQLGGGGTGQASALYLLAYYLGSSVFGALAGAAWTSGGWPRVIEMTTALTAIAAALALAQTRTRRLDRPRGTLGA